MTSISLKKFDKFCTLSRYWKESVFIGLYSWYIVMKTSAYAFLYWPHVKSMKPPINNMQALFSIRLYYILFYKLFSPMVLWLFVYFIFTFQKCWIMKLFSQMIFPKLLGDICNFCHLKRQFLGSTCWSVEGPCGKKNKIFSYS